MDPDFLDRSYVAFPEVEVEFSEALDETLAPRGPEVLYDLVSEMELPAGAVAADVGCGDGRHAFRLAERFGLEVTGVDPVAHPEDTDHVRFLTGTAEALPLHSFTVDLVWCRDVLLHVTDLDAAYREFARVLRPGGRALVYQTFVTARLEPAERDWLFETMGVVPQSADPARTEAAIRSAALWVDDVIDLRGEWGERDEEESGGRGRRLLHAARLLREPDRYIERFGRDAYDIMLGDCLWHVYGMLGKLESRVYLLSKPS